MIRSRGRRQGRRPRREARFAAPAALSTQTTISAQLDIAANDPIVAYFQSAPGPVEVDKLRIESPGLDALRDAGVKLVVPLVSQGELIGLLNLGPRLSEQEYSADDRRLLENLAGQAAPAVRVAQLVREQESEIRTRERYQQELRIAHLIQQNYLPKTEPDAGGWQFAAHYQSAREVGGDFYDFIELPDGRIGIVIGDVTDKGVPAALVMASTRSVLRGAALSGRPPGQILERVNDVVCHDMPPKMFATCLYAVFDPASGHMVFANAGHNLPYRRSADGVDELRARGMPLGLMTGMSYEECEVTIAPGEVVLFTSDGIAEAHSPDGDMYGCPRIVQVVERYRPGFDLRDALLNDLHGFTGDGWEQEDDITMVLVERSPHQASDFESASAPVTFGERIVDEFEVASEPGNERLAMQKVVDAIAVLELPPDRLERVKTAVAEATMNAIEHGNENRAELPVSIKVATTGDELRITIVDFGGAKEVPESTSPDIDAKLAGEQTPRGWGLFLIRNMVDEMNASSDGTHHVVELVVRLRGE